MANKRSPRKLYDAAERGNLDLVQELIAEGVNVNGAFMAAGTEKTTPLHAAAMGDHVEIIRALIDAGAELESRNGEDCTPFFVAVACGNIGAIRALLEAGARIDASDFRSTPLEHARGQLDHYRKELERVRQPEHWNEEKERLINKAKYIAGHEEAIKHVQEVVEVLEAAGATADIPPEDLAEDERRIADAEPVPTIDFTTQRGVLDRYGNSDELHVLAPPGEVAEALRAIRPSGALQTDVRHKQFVLAEAGCLVALHRGHRWSLVLDRDSPLCRYDYEAEAQALSRALETRALHFGYSDTGGACEYKLFKSGDLLEHLLFVEGEVVAFESALRKVGKKRIEKERYEFADAFLKELDVLAAYLHYSVLIPGSAKPGSRVELTDCDWLDFERVDYLELDPDDPPKQPNPLEALLR